MMVDDESGALLIGEDSTSNSSEGGSESDRAAVISSISSSEDFEINASEDDAEWGDMLLQTDASALEDVCLVGHNLDDAALVDLCGSSFLKARTKIRSLDLSGNHIEGPALEQMMNLIKEALQLDILRLSDNAITDQGVHHLSPLVSQVSHLDLSLNQVSASGLCSLLEGFSPTGQSKLRILNLKGNSIGDDGALLIAQVLDSNAPLKSSLLELDLSNNALEAQGVSAILKAAASSNIRSLIIDDSKPDLACLVQDVASSRVRKISLRCCGLGDDEACRLAQALALGSGTCQELDLRDNKSCQCRGRTALQGVIKVRKGYEAELCRAGAETDPFLKGPNGLSERSSHRHLNLDALPPYALPRSHFLKANERIFGHLVRGFL